MDVIELTRANHNEVLELFGDDKVHYYFLIDDMLRNNYKNKSFQVFGEYEDGKLVSLLLNNHNNITYYSNSNRPISCYKGLLEKLTFTKLSGDSQWVEKFLPYVKVKQDTLSYMGVVKKIRNEEQYPNGSIGFINTVEEIAMQYDLLMSTDEFKDTLPKNKKVYIEGESRRLDESKGRTAYLRIDNKMASSSSTIMEGEKSAIIIGVVTNPKFRKKGYGSEVLKGLFEVLLKEGKYPYLFYNNPAARSVYKKIGMTEVCQWRVVFVDK